MKRLLVTLLTAFMLLTVCGCTGGNGGKTDPVEPEVKGTVVDFGRISALVPEGWSQANIGEYSTDFNAVIVKGTADDFMKKPGVSALYFLPSEWVISNRQFYENTHDLDPIDNGDYHWTLWYGTYNEQVSYTAECTGDFGTINVVLQNYGEESEKLTMDDPEVRAFIKSITVEPFTEADWVKFENGEAVATLPVVEGYQWEDSGSMYTTGVDAWAEVIDNVLYIRPEAGSGTYSQNLQLNNEEGTFYKGQVQVDVRITDGKADALYTANLKLLDEPVEIEQYEYEDNTDYESLDQYYSGTWIDKNNDLTMFIQKIDDIDHSYLINIQSSDKQMSATGRIQTNGELLYTGMIVDGVEVETYGWFTPDSETVLLWSRENDFGGYENATIFNKAE